MKRFLVPLIVVMLLILTALPAYAGGGDPADAETSVVISDLEVTSERANGEIYNGDEYTVSGSITVTGDAEVQKFLSVAHTEGEASYEIVDNLGDVISSGLDISSDTDAGWFSAEASTSITLNWSDTLTASVNSVFVEQAGYALAWAAGFFSFDISETDKSMSTELSFSNEPHSKWRDTNRFQLETQTASSISSYHWADGEHGHILRDGADQEADGLRVVIPAGTIINEGLSWQGTFSVKYTEKYGFKFLPRDITFSNPVNVYYNGDLIATFTQVIDGNAS